MHFIITHDLGIIRLELMTSTTSRWHSTAELYPLRIVTHSIIEYIHDWYQQFVTNEYAYDYNIQKKKKFST